MCCGGSEAGARVSFNRLFTSSEGERETDAVGLICSVAVYTGVSGSVFPPPPPKEGSRCARPSACPPFAERGGRKGNVVWLTHCERAWLASASPRPLGAQGAALTVCPSVR